MKTIGLLLGLIVAQWVQAGSSDRVANQFAVLALQPGERQGAVIDYVQVMEDASLKLGLEDVYYQAQQNRFQALKLDHIDFGFSHSRFWLRIPVVNAGAEQGVWMLSLNTRFMNELAAYWVGQEGPQLLVQDSDTRLFSERKVQYRNLVGHFSLAPLEKGYLLIGYRSAGTTALPLTIETQASFYQRWIDENTINVAFYAAMLFMVLFSLLHVVILRSKVYFSYACYVGSALLYVFHMDGLSFQYLWPGAPTWNAHASLHLALISNICAIAFARSFLGTATKHVIVDKMLLLPGVAAVLMMIASVVVDGRLLKQLSFMVVSSGALMCWIAGIVAYRGGQKSARFYIVGWTGIFLVVSLLSVTHWIKSLIPVPLGFDISKIGIFFDAMMFSLALADQANEIRKQRDVANAREKALLEKDLQVHKQMYFLERQYENALSLAQQKSLQLASAGHDLRQPIVALRMAMQSIYENQQTDPATIAHFRKGFDYIEALIKQYLELPAKKSGETPSGKATVGNAKPEKITKTVLDVSSGQERAEQPEVFAIQIILDNIAHMFSDEARDKALVWRSPSCSVTVKASPVVVMRIVSNLVDNAIKYTEKGKVLVGCRRRGDQLEVQVCDTGTGISAKEQQRLINVLERGKGQDSTGGLGLGLAIASELAQSHHHALTIRSQLSRGTIMSIQLPVCGQSSDTVVN